MLRQRAYMLLNMLLISTMLLIPITVPSRAIMLEKTIGTPLNVAEVGTGLEVLAAVAEVDEVPLIPKLEYMVEPTGHLVVFTQQPAIVVQDLATELTETYMVEPLCKPIVLDDLSEVKHVLLRCANRLIYYLSLENTTRLYGPYRLLETDIVGVKQVGEHVIVVHPNGLIVVYKGSLMDPYKVVKLPIKSSIREAYITQSTGNYTGLVAVTSMMQKGWFVAVIDLDTGSIVYSWSSTAPLVATYVVDAHSPSQFKLLTIEYSNGTTTLELTTIVSSKPVLRVRRHMQLPTVPQVFLYKTKQSYMLAIVGGGLGYLVDVYPDSMLIKTRFAWNYLPTVKEYAPVVIHEDKEYIITIDDEGLKLLDSSGAPQWHVAAPCKTLAMVYGCDRIVVIGCEEKLVIIRPKQEFFKKLALLMVHAPKLHGKTPKEAFIPTITVSRPADNINISVRTNSLSLLLPPGSYSVKAVYEKLNIVSEMHIVLKPPQTKVEIPIKTVKYVICVKGLEDPLRLLPQGKPIAGATVQFYTVENVKLAEAKTGEDGCTQISLPYTLYRVLVSAPGYRENVFEIVGQNNVVFLEPKLAPLEVRVVDAVTGREIPNAQVEIVGFGRRVVVPANTIVSVPLGTYALTSIAEGYSSKKVEVAVNGPESVEIAVEPLPTIVRVVDGLTGLPIDSFQVSVSGWTIYGDSYHVSRKARQYVSLRLPPGYYTLTISAEDYEVKRLVVKAPTSETVKLWPRLTEIAERQIKTMFKLLVSNPTHIVIIIMLLLAVALVKLRRRIRDAIERIRKKVEEASKARRRKEEVLEELRKLVEEVGI